MSAANVTSGLGILLKGRQLTVLRALDKKSAHEKEMEKTKTEDHDHRNLYLAKVGLGHAPPTVLTTSCFCIIFGVTCDG